MTAKAKPDPLIHPNKSVSDRHFLPVDVGKWKLEIGKLSAPVRFPIFSATRRSQAKIRIWLHLAPFETEGGGNAIKSQDLWIGDTIRFPSPAPVILLPTKNLAIGRGGKRRQ